MLDLLYPRSCAGCGGGLGGDERHLCWSCRSELRLIGPPLCSLCGNPVEGRVDHAFRCYHCEEARPHFDLARSAARFDGLMRRLVHDFKYHGALWLTADLTDLLEACARAHLDPAGFDVVTWIPLHAVRRRERGYNQAQVLAGALARRLGLPAERLLGRVRRTTTQTHLTASQRAHNVRAAFEAGRGAAGRRILLVDDVMTTGATASESARALKEAGAVEVAVVTLVRGG
jgi:competence protein ComFC